MSESSSRKLKWFANMIIAVALHISLNGLSMVQLALSASFDPDLEFWIYTVLGLLIPVLMIRWVFSKSYRELRSRIVSMAEKLKVRFFWFHIVPLWWFISSVVSMPPSNYPVSTVYFLLERMDVVINFVILCMSLLVHRDIYQIARAGKVAEQE